MRARRLALILLLAFPSPSWAQCASNDAVCWNRHRSERMEDQMREDQRRNAEHLEKMMEGFDRQEDQGRASNPLPRPSCADASELGSFSRGYRAGGLLGAFANVDEEKRRCEAEAARAKEAATAGAAKPSELLARQSAEHDAKVSKYMQELRNQATYDPQLARRTCAYQQSTVNNPDYDVAYVVACISLGLIK